MSAAITGPPALPFYAIADSGCTTHFFSPSMPVCNKCPTTAPVAIHTPSGDILHSTHEADLDVPGLPPSARHGHIIPNLATQPLLSIGQLCDTGCDVALRPPPLPSITTTTSSYKVHVHLRPNCGSSTSNHLHPPMPTPPLAVPPRLISLLLPMPLYSARHCPPWKTPCGMATCLRLRD